MLSKVLLVVILVASVASAARLRSNDEALDHFKSGARVDNCDVSSGWIPHSGSCYKVFSDRYLTWTAARQACIAEGAFLAEPKTAEADNFLRGQLWAIFTAKAAKSDSQDYWIGARKAEDGAFVWDNSGKRVGFAAWTVQTEKDDGPYVNYCGNKNDYCGDYRWIANADSNSDNGFICQK